MKRPLRMAVGAALAVVLSFAAHTKNAGEAAPDFTRPALSGEPVHLAQYRGKLVLLNFWASWCGPCLEEMPRFSAWQRDYGPRGLQVIGISMDDGAATAKRLLAKRPVAYPILMGDSALGELFGGVLGLPQTYLIDAGGRIVGRYQGGQNLKAMEAQIRSLLPHPGR